MAQVPETPSEGSQTPSEEKSLQVEEIPKWPGDWRAYLALVSGFFMMFNCWGMINAYGAFMGLYDQHLLTRATDVQLSLIGSTECFLLLFPSIFAGRLLDAKKHYILGFTGFVLLSLGYFLLSFTSHSGLRDQGNYGFIWLTSGLAAGLGMTCFFTYSSHNVIQWFPRNRYLASGITSTGAGAGGIIYPLAFKFLVARYGFPTGVRILSSIVFGTTLIAFIGGAPSSGVARRNLRPIFNTATWIDRQALTNRSYIFYILAVSLIYGGFYSLAFHVTEWAEAEGFGTEEDISGGSGVRPGNSGFRTFWFLTIMNGTSIIGRLGGAVIATRWSNPIAVHSACCFVAALLALFFWPFAPNNGAAIAFCSIFGVLGGAILSLPASGIAFLIPDDRRNLLGQWTGTMWSTVSVFALVQPMIAAALRRRFGMDSIGYWTGASLFLAGVLLVVAMRMKERKNDAAEKDRTEGNAV